MIEGKEGRREGGPTSIFLFAEGSTGADDKSSEAGMGVSVGTYTRQLAARVVPGREQVHDGVGHWGKLREGRVLYSTALYIHGYNMFSLSRARVISG